MKRTPLHDLHVELGARLVDFAGWRMPLQYRGILEEGRAVRSGAGLFDLSHMGRLRLVGPDAVRLTDRLCTNHCAPVPAGGIRYSLLCRDDGAPLDDLLFYKERGGVLWVVNAANTERDLAWAREHAADLEAEVEDVTSATAMLAVQGPSSQEILSRISEGVDLEGLRYYRFAFATVAGKPGTRVSRTGYTGDDGFEVYVEADDARDVWQALCEAGREHSLVPAGLGARDVLRLEAGMALYGHEVDERSNPFEAGLAFCIALTPEKGDFVGREALERAAQRRERRLVGLTTAGPRVPRQGNALLYDGQPVGEVCSGGVSPTLETNIGSAYVRLGLDAEGRELELELRGGKRQRCEVRELPFYSRTRSKKTQASGRPRQG